MGCATIIPEPTPRRPRRHEIALAASEAIVFGHMPPAGHHPATPHATELTAREREVLWMVGQGLSNGETAARLELSVETVKSHMRRVLGKLGARNRCHAVTLAYEFGVFTPATAAPGRDDPPAGAAPGEPSSPVHPA